MCGRMSERRRHVLISICVLGAMAFVIPAPRAQVFSPDTTVSLPGVEFSAAAWADYDNDGDLDILLTGSAESGPLTQLYRNDGGTFVESGIALEGVAFSAATWGDYDRDGDVDILIAGFTTSGRQSLIYQNNGGTFANIGAGLPGVDEGSTAWADYDNDGDLDILLTGFNDGGAIATIYRNDGGTFNGVVGLDPVSRGAVAWGDYDNDGDYDVLLTGSGSGGRTAVVYQNTDGSFSNIGAGLTGVEQSAVAWGDYDNDGDLDILLVGLSNAGQRIARVYRNDGSNVFTNIGASLVGVDQGSVAWGDSDNDGDLDILISGTTNSGRSSRVYRNDGGAFVNSGAALEPVDNGSVAWGDYDQDGDLDILLTGSGNAGAGSRVYRNEAAVSNMPPSSPANPTAQVVGTSVTLTWDPGVDTETPSAGLTYNLRIGTTPGGSEIMSAMTDPSTGFGRVVQLGNTNHRTSWTVKLPALGIYYWSVQAVDAGFARSTSPEQVVLTSFMNSNVALEPVVNGAVAWGDYDNDGNLDVLITGDSNCCGRISRVYRNDGGGNFVNINANLEPVSSGAVAWGDYDNDGDLDILLTGYSNCCYLISRVYRNQGGIFADIGAGLQGVYLSTAAWGDYDNDGDLDILIAGWYGGRSTYIYKNTSGAFSQVIGLDGMSEGSAAWGDYDNDGDLDILMTGYFNSYGPSSRVYRNNGGSFADQGNPGFPYVYNASSAWGDFDGDGDLDALIAGSGQAGVYRNQNGSFSNIGASLAGIQSGTAAWGDYDNDGDLDILLTGSGITLVYRNHGGTFVNTESGLQGASNCAAAWGDYDGDGDLDLLVTGNHGCCGVQSYVYRNNATTLNAAPNPPLNLAVDVAGTIATFRWDAASDDHTAAPTLTYELRIGTTPGVGDVMPTPSAAVNGWRRVVQMGSTNHRRAWTVKLPGPRQYYWTVQSVDAAFNGSDFAPEQSFLTGFSEVSAGLEGVSESASAWGDYDNDGDLDLLLTGNANNGPISRLYRNQGGGFADVGAGLEGVYRSSVAWGDYDRDGDLDILLSGRSNNFGRITRIYRNNGGSFVDVISLEGVEYSSAAWGDFDNDGDLDIVLAGESNCCGRLSRLYRNNVGIFTQVQDLDGMTQGSLAWGDIDNDGDLDLVMSGYFNCCGQYTHVYRNDSGSFNDMGQLGIDRYYISTVSLGDYDNDGDLDALAAGEYYGQAARIYRNQGGSFTSVANLEGVKYSSGAWGDYDNDGDLDVLIAGYSDSYGRLSRVYRNQGGSFTDIGAGLEGAHVGSATWADYDADGDLDILVTGDASPGRVARLYRNNALIANTPPAAPTNPNVSIVVGGNATFSWNAAIDTQTPSAGLTYNLRVGTTPGGSEVSAAMANAANGFRRIVQMGNANHNLSWSIPLSSIPLTSKLYFSVQAIDHDFAGSPFSVEKAFGAMPEITSIRDVGNDQGRQVRVRWMRSLLDAPNASPLITSYALWRRVGPYKPASAASNGGNQRPDAMPPGTWDFVLSVPARGNDSYSVVAPTLCDSTSAGVCYSVFVVSGITTDPHTYFDADPDSGYSIDNLAPTAPLNLLAQTPGAARITLSWEEVNVADLAHYAVYRGGAPGVQPNEAARIGYSTTPDYEDVVATAGVYYYVVTAVDFAGNEGPPSAERMADVSETSDAPGVKYIYALRQNRPNPFNPSTKIVFELAEAGSVRLVVYDARGTAIATLVDWAMPSGIHEVHWNGTDDRGVSVSSGEYFYKLEAGVFTERRKMTLLR